MKSSTKGILALVGVAALLVVCWLGYSAGKRDAATNLNQRISELAGQVDGLKEQKKKDDLEHVKTEAALEVERELRIKSDAKVVRLEAANNQLAADNASYREQLKQWDDRTIAVEMAKRIGEEEVADELRGRWHFSLTRVGGERTLGIFKDSETNFSLAENRKLQLIEKDTQIASLNVSYELQKAETKREADGRVAALTELDKATTIITDQKKELRRKKLESFLKGTAAGVVVVAVLEAIFGK